MLREVGFIGEPAPLPVSLRYLRNNLRQQQSQLRLLRNLHWYCIICVCADIQDNIIPLHVDYIYPSSISHQGFGSDRCHITNFSFLTEEENLFFGARPELFSLKLKCWQGTIISTLYPSFLREHSRYCVAHFVFGKPDDLTMLLSQLARQSAMQLNRQIKDAVSLFARVYRYPCIFSSRG